MRVTINLPDELLSRVDKGADKLFISRSAYIATALAQKLQQDEVIEKMPDFMSEIRELRKLAEKQVQEPETVSGE